MIQGFLAADAFSRVECKQLGEQVEGLGVCLGIHGYEGDTRFNGKRADVACAFFIIVEGNVKIEDR